MHDVAREAGVSTATVSRVLNGGRVRPATARAVRRAMDRLGYVPNRVARGLVTGRTEVVGVLVPDLVGPLNAAVARGVEDALEARGMHAVMMTDHRDAVRERQRLATLIARRVDGLVLIGSELADEEILAAVGATPIVHVGAERPRERLPEVRVDNAAGVRAALARLEGAGHRRVAHLAGPRRDGRERAEALRRFAAGHGVELVAAEDADFSEEGGLRAGRALLAGGGFSAVVCANDRSAVGLLAATREAGLRVPGDLSVIGFDDLPWSGYLAPPLTTVRQPSRDLGRQAAERVLDPLGPDAWQGVRLLAPTLIDRASVARAPPGPFLAPAGATRHPPRHPPSPRPRRSYA
jgi:LacI family transcriptional regulator